MYACSNLNNAFIVLWGVRDFKFRNTCNVFPSTFRKLRNFLKHIYCEEHYVIKLKLLKPKNVNKAIYRYDISMMVWHNTKCVSVNFFKLYVCSLGQITKAKKKKYSIFLNFMELDISRYFPFSSLQYNLCVTICPALRLPVWKRIRANNEFFRSLPINLLGFDRFIAYYFAVWTW